MPKHIELFHSLVQMAAVDGKFTEQELRLLIDRADKWGVPNDEFETAMAGVTTGRSTVTVPEADADRVELLSELIKMMAVDGHLSPEEKDLCARVAAHMGYGTEKLELVIAELLREHSAHHPSDGSS